VPVLFDSVDLVHRGEPPKIVVRRTYFSKGLRRLGLSAFLGVVKCHFSSVEGAVKAAVGSWRRGLSGIVKEPYQAYHAPNTSAYSRTGTTGGPSNGSGATAQLQSKPSDYT